MPIPTSPSRSSLRDEAIVRVEGALTVGGVEARRVEFAAVLDRARSLTLDLSAATEIDVFGIQLLCAARRSTGARGGAFRVIDPAGVLARACESVGLSPTVLLEPLSPSFP